MKPFRTIPALPTSGALRHAATLGIALGLAAPASAAPVSGPESTAAGGPALLPDTSAVKDPQRLAEEGLRLYREAFHGSDRALQVKQYELAARCFVAAIAAGGESARKLHHPLGLVYEKLERNVDAVDSFQRYLASVPESQRRPGATRQVTEKLAALRPLVSELEIETAPGIEVRVDARLVGTSPLPGTIVVAPGAHTVTVGNSEVGVLGSDLRVDAGRTRHVNLTGWRRHAREPTLRPRPAPIATDPRMNLSRTKDEPAPPRKSRAWVFGVVAGAVVIAGAGAALGGYYGTHSNTRDADGSYTPTP